MNYSSKDILIPPVALYCVLIMHGFLEAYVIPYQHQNLRKLSEWSDFH